MSRPSGQTPREWRGRRREGSAPRARAEPRPGRRRAAGRSRSSAGARPPTGSGPCRSSRRIGASWGAGGSCVPPRRSPSWRRRDGRAIGRPCPAPSAAPSDRPAAVRARTSQIARRDHVDLVPRAPELDERRLVPDHRVGALDPRVDRQHRGPRHAVLQARPGRLAERMLPGGEPLVDRADPPPEGEDLRPGERETGAHHHINRL